MDYARYGRQIALPEIGVAGQQRLADAPLVAPDAVRGMASQLWEAAGGASTGAQGGAGDGGPPVLGEAAWWCVESARRALGQESRELPADLLARLGP